MMDNANKIEAILECPVCRDVLKNTIYLCATGHSFCNSCTNRLKTCPICRQLVTKCRNYTLEALTEEISKNLEKSQSMNFKTWKFSELRNIINNSKDPNLMIECCNETARRLKIYKEWKTKFANQLGRIEIYLQGKDRISADDKEADPDRFFRTPIALKISSKIREKRNRRGWWYLNFKNGFIIKQILIHPDNMSQINLLQDEFHKEFEEFDLIPNRWVEITENCFSSLWVKGLKS